MDFLFPSLKTNIPFIDEAYRIALADFTGNIAPFKDGLLQHEVPCILAGLDYVAPWTRDAAINVWNGAAILVPQIAKNTLLSVLMKDPSGKIRIGGQYWDAIIWVTGAWNTYLMTGDKDFLQTAFEASRNSLEYFEETEFDDEAGLFRGPACYGDGVSAYPDAYAITKNGSSGIEDWPEANPQLRATKGAGIPMFALSTNCLYAHAYSLIPLMGKVLNLKNERIWSIKAKNLQAAINLNFWNTKKNSYRYLADKLGACDNQEGLGNCFVILFNIADQLRKKKILKGQPVTKSGIPCIWPAFERYRKEPLHYGRHSGTVWPHVQGFWADICAREGLADKFGTEFFTLAKHAVRDCQFTEIYHPDTGQIYGGLQEFQDLPSVGTFFNGIDRNSIPAYKQSNIREWNSCRRQTWSATAFIRMVLNGLLGMRFTEDGLSLHPTIPQGLDQIRSTEIHYRKAVIDVTIKGSGAKVALLKVNGKSTKEARISAHASGKYSIDIRMK